MKHCCVLDGSTGQNALEQAKHFTATTDVTALAITKLDGTAKGEVVLAIANQVQDTGKVHWRRRKDGRPAGLRQTRVCR